MRQITEPEWVSDSLLISLEDTPETEMFIPDPDFYWSVRLPIKPRVNSAVRWSVGTDVNDELHELYPVEFDE